jgi:Tfp pilus assembly protein PilN
MEADAIAVTRSTSESHGAMERFIHAIDASSLIEDVTMRPLRYENDRTKGSRVELEFSLSAALRLVREGAAS